MLTCLECVGGKSRTPMCGKFTTIVSSSCLFLGGKGFTAREEGLHGEASKVLLLCVFFLAQLKSETLVQSSHPLHIDCMDVCK